MSLTARFTNSLNKHVQQLKPNLQLIRLAHINITKLNILTIHWPGQFIVAVTRIRSFALVRTNSNEKCCFYHVLCRMPEKGVIGMESCKVGFCLNGGLAKRRWDQGGLVLTAVDWFH